MQRLEPGVIGKLKSYNIDGLETVISELIQNSLDANASDITVKINLSTFTVIIIDNGDGMNREVLESLGEFKTTKIKSLHDLETATTYGFKGESLCNIDNISKLSIISKVNHDTASYKCTMGGTATIYDFADDIENPLHNNFYHLSPLHHGTIIMARDVFYNIPIRQHPINQYKFIDQLRHRLIYLRPCNLKIYINKELKITTVVGENLINQIFGFNIKFRIITCKVGMYNLKAYISNEIKRGYQFTLYNNRPIDINFPLQNICLLYFEGPVSISDLFNDSTKKIWYSKHEDNLINILTRIFPESIAKSPSKGTSPRKSPIKARSPKKSTINQYFLKTNPKSISPNRIGSPMYAGHTKDLPLTKPFTHTISYPSLCTTVNNTNKLTKLTKATLTKIQIINQIDQKFILVKSSNQLLLIDQHAMDERIKVEKLFKSFLHDMELVPCCIKLNLNPQEAELFKQFDSYIQQFFKINNNYIVKMPKIVHHDENLFQHLMDYLNDIKSNKKLKLSNNWFNDINNLPNFLINLINTKACRSAIMFGDDLTIYDMQRMINELVQCNLPFQCAHGRPCIIPLIDI